MASAPSDPRRAALSSKPKGRENAKDTLCRNVTIYGHCRYEDKGCAFNHDPTKSRGATNSAGKRLNVDSPTFTPSSQHATLAIADPNRGTGLSPKAANAAPFKPKGLGSGLEFNSNSMRKTYNPNAPEWALGSNGDAAEFVPQTHGIQTGLGDTNGALQGLFDTYGGGALLGHSPNQQQAQVNPYAQDTNSNGTMYGGGMGFMAPAPLHWYKSAEQPPKNMLPYQRPAPAFFMSETLREDLHRKNEATLQVFPNSALPSYIEPFHSLVPLDKTHQRNTALFGYSSWIFKVVSAKDGKMYALRRIEGYKLTNEKAIRTIRAWKNVSNANVVTIVDAFTSRAFGDSSLMIQTAYHARSQTLSELHLSSTPRAQARALSQHVPEATLWQYLIQIANALRSIHGAGLAARLIEPSKILVTDKDRIRLNGCGILDIVQYEVPRTIGELQKDDFKQFGRLIVALGTNRPSVTTSLSNALDHFNRVYSAQLKDRVYWLLNQGGPDRPSEGIEKFMSGMVTNAFSAFDAAEQHDDELTSELSTALENDRIARLSFKLHTIVDHPLRTAQFPNVDRDPVKLFRDYVFHQVDSQGNPKIDLAHVTSALNKVDAGTDEKVIMTSRDDQIVIVASYKDIKRHLSSAFEEIKKAQTPIRSST